MPALQELYQTELQEQNVNVIGITQFNTTQTDAQSFVNQHQLTFENIFDPEAAIAQNFNVNGVPYYIYIDKQGKIANVTSGARGVQTVNNIIQAIATEQ